jgi:anti-anti-sigma factor
MQQDIVDGSGGTIVPSLDISTAPDLRQELQHAIATGCDVLLDLSEVEVCDVAGLQVLMAASRSAQSAGIGFRIARMSGAVTDAVRMLGLEPAQLTGSPECTRSI